MQANIQQLNGGHTKAKGIYRTLLRMGLKADFQSKVLNNLAISSFSHALETSRTPLTDKEEQNTIQQEADYVETYLKQSLEVNEKMHLASKKDGQWQSSDMLD